MADSNKAINLLREFYDIVNSIYGVYLDSTRGFDLVKKQQIEVQQLAIQKLAKTHPAIASVDCLDKRKMIYSAGDPNKPDSVVLHACSQAELKARNEKGGHNCQFVANMCLVTIYQYWEDQYRGAIASAFEAEKNAIKSDIMGDIKHLRSSIIHNRAKAVKEVEKCKLLKWFKRGEQISISEDMFKELIRQIYEFIEGLAKKLN